MSRGRLLAAATGGLAVVLCAAFASGHRTIFLPGATSAGHHLMEGRCDACHAPFARVPDRGCTGCHRADLAHDTHPAALFDDPRWADDLASVDAAHCRTCHAEHRIARGGVTIPEGFCAPCHDDVTRTRPSHRGLGPGTCATAGCHNYHDNTVLNAGFLRRRLDQPPLLPAPAVAARTLGPRRGPAAGAAASPAVAATPALRAAYAASLHAAEGVTCADCHQLGRRDAPFDPHPGTAACARCHAREVETFHAGPHGVREALGLAALTPADARLPMKARDGRPRAMACGACHDPHAVDTRFAAVKACLGCHDDEHSRAFLDSPHAGLLAADRGAWPGPQSVTCATCHLPRERVEGPDGARVAVNHNNGFTLAPRDRMLKSVCLSCHGLPFALASLADERLVRNNFRGRPHGPHPTVSMLREGRVRPAGI